MVLELLWLLLPVAAASGWWAGRSSARRQDQGQRTGRGGVVRPPSDYFRGLNYLLDEQPDKAIEVFLRLVEVDSETIETHLALGNLFRRRGEVDRAIRIHQNLIARPNLASEHRSYALLELARDYMRAGVLDRAEGLFSELVRTRTHVAEASRQLLTIYEREREWNAAIETADRLQRVTGESQQQLIAHYWCELADSERRSGNDRAARKLAQRALAADENSVRASILEGQIAMDAGQYRQAVRAFRRVESQDPAFLPEVIEPLLTALAQVEHASALEAYIERLRGRYNGISVIQAATNLIREREGYSAARDFFREQLLKRPSLRGLREWVALELEHASERSRPGTEIVLDMLDRLLESKPVYQCSQCGFQGKQLQWQCPSCRSWNTVKPIIGIEGE
ncbi:MAG: lipopolysaccharide assembly protein LapB [Halofilum sp. (in: g-proteobacteria)]|nr:lipopolysaccharide assembly protein LapB [Halofilum sp. (in: g-proteobacteria)]